MAIAGFDPSLTNFGWVLLDEERTGAEALIDFGSFKTSTKEGMLVQRLISQRERVRKFLSDNKVKMVASEAPYYMDFNTELLFSLHQFVHEAYLDMGVYVIYISPSTLCKQAYPDKNPQDITKHHMVHLAKTELNRHGKRLSEHMADAYFAARTGVRFYQWYFKKSLKEEDLTKEEWDFFCHKRTITRGPRKGIIEYNGLIYRENEKFFDYSKQERKTKNIIEEIKNG